MNIQRYLGAIAIGSWLCIWGIAQPAVAQTGSQSDVSGAIITSGDIIGGFFAPPLGSGGGFDFVSLPVQNATNIAAALTNQQLASGEFKVASARNLTAPSSLRVQQLLRSALTDGENAEASINQLQAALSDSNLDPTLVKNLATSLKGLTAANQVDPNKFAAAIAAYNSLIDRASDSYVQNPPEALTAIQTVLSTLVNASLAAAK